MKQYGYRLAQVGAKVMGKIRISANYINVAELAEQLDFIGVEHSVKITSIQSKSKKSLGKTKWFATVEVMYSALEFHDLKLVINSFRVKEFDLALRQDDPTYYEQRLRVEWGSYDSARLSTRNTWVEFKGLYGRIAKKIGSFEQSEEFIWLYRESLDLLAIVENPNYECDLPF